MGSYVAQWITVLYIMKGFLPNSVSTAYKFQFTAANWCLSKYFQNEVIKPVSLTFDHPSNKASFDVKY